jgi:hypothetical protein
LGSNYDVTTPALLCLREWNTLSAPCEGQNGGNAGLIASVFLQAIESNYSRAPVCTDSLSAVLVIRGLSRPEKKHGKLKAINGS